MRALLKQPQQHQDKKTASTPLVVNPSKKEKKQEKKPEGPIGLDPHSLKEQNQYTPEEMDAIRALLKQPQQHQDKKTASTPLVVNPSKKEKKQEKKPEGPIGL
ncbi:hypothetical protein B7P43_G17972 [Cryptotermes secundus]|uniref:Uncharacterized protein n=2 Tax=Cryptotermes secundus TaxID=105785 RepID=A0A2J7PIM5_9NEOP|nr:hypothetical protein B7P43_G17972 [Cryptotermes secundus]